MADGCNAQATGACSHAEGNNTTASGFASHAEGFETLASSDAASAGGIRTKATGRMATARGQDTTASGLLAHAEGYSTLAEGEASHAEGRNAQARGSVAHAQGESTKANGAFSHAEGIRTIAGNIGDIDSAVHAEGYETRAVGLFGTHAEGLRSVAAGRAAHAEGSDTVANGIASHAEGINTAVHASASHVEGEGNFVDAAFANSHIMGRFGDVDEPNSWFIGNGTASALRGVGARWSGSTFDMSIAGTSYITGGQDYAEMFETEDGSSIDAGFFIAPAKGKKIRKATTADRFILGITSAMPSIRGNSAELNWQGKYLTDEWGRKKYQLVAITKVVDQDGNIIEPTRTEMQAMINPEWNPNRIYISRIERPEWVTVGLLGQILVRDDGTCEEHGYCWPNDEGIATKAGNGYFVLERTGPNQILVLFR